MAAPTWQNGTTLTGSTTTSAVVTLPASIAANDILIVTLYKENTNAVTLPGGGGWTEKGTAPATNGPQAQHTFWFRAAGGESGTVTFSWTGSVYRAATCDRISGCTTSGDPIGDISTNFNNTSGTTTPAVSLTGTPADSLLFWAATNFAGGSSFVPPGGFTEREDLIDVLECATEDNSAGGDTGSLTGTANISGKLTAVLISLVSSTGVSAPAGVATAQAVAVNAVFPFTAGVGTAQAAAPSASVTHFPVIPTGGQVITGVQANTTATRTFPDLSTLTKNAGDLLIAVVFAYQSTATANAVFSSWTGGFTEFGDFSTTSSIAIGVAYKISTGSETGTFAVTEAATITGSAAFIVMAVPAADSARLPEAGGYASGTNANADPGSLTPSWGAADDLWIAVAGSGETGTGGTFTGLASGPANYSSYTDTGISNDAIGGIEGAVAFRQLNGTSENPGTFTSDTTNSRWAGITIAVRPPVATAANAGAATASAAAVSPSVTIGGGGASAPAGVAAVSAVAAAASKAVTASAGPVAVSAVAPAAKAADTANAGAAAAQAAAQAPVTAHTANAGVATVSAAATAAKATETANAGAATVAAAAAAPTVSTSSSTNVPAGVAAATATAPAPSTAVTVTAGVAAAAAAAAAAKAAETVNAGVAAVSAPALQPTVSTSSSTNVPAGVAAVTATAAAPSTAVTVTAGVAAAQAVATAATAADKATAGVATAAGAAPSPSAAVTASAAAAVAGVTAANTTVNTSGSTNAPAGVATAAAAAAAPSKAVTANAGVAAAAAVAPAPLSAVTVPAGAATVAAAAAAPTVSTSSGTNAPAGVATVSVAAAAPSLAVAARTQAAAILAVALQTRPPLQKATSSPTAGDTRDGTATVGRTVTSTPTAAGPRDGATSVTRTVTSTATVTGPRAGTPGVT